MTTHSISAQPAFATYPETLDPRTLEAFQQRFKCSLSRCVKRGFCVQEAFGVIWEETLETFSPSEHEQSFLYNELLSWAQGMKR